VHQFAFSQNYCILIKDHTQQPAPQEVAVTHESTSNGGKEIWEGKLSGLKKAWKEYQHDPEKLVAAASAVYSFRHARDRRGWQPFRSLLRMFARKLLMRAEKLITNDASKTDTKKAENAAETVAALLIGLSIYEPDDDPKEELITAAVRLCEHGLRIASRAKGEHTFSLLLLDKVDLNRIPIDSGEHKSLGISTTWSLLAVVAAYAPHIKDRNQRVRVQAKLGRLYRRGFYFGLGWVLGIWWGTCAVMISGVSLNVRWKAVASFIPWIR
jgi:hypothetical protein